MDEFDDDIIDEKQRKKKEKSIEKLRKVLIADLGKEAVTNLPPEAISKFHGVLEVCAEILYEKSQRGPQHTCVMCKREHPIDTLEDYCSTNDRQINLGKK